MCLQGFWPFFIVFFVVIVLLVYFINMEDYCHHYMYKDLSDEELKYMRAKAVELTAYLLKGQRITTHP